MKKIFTLLFGMLIIGFTSFAQTNVPALITSDQTWGPSGSPYLISQNTYVDTGITITVLPGTEVKSTTGGLSLAVDGQIVAKGNANSRITFKEFEMKFTNKSIGYDFNNNTGTQFDYCDFIGQGVGSRILNLNGMDLKVTNSNFTKGYYGVYTSGSTANKVLIDQCSFDDFDNKGYPIYSSSYKGIVILKNSFLNNFYGLYAYGDLYIEKNIFNDFNKLNFNIYAPSIITCNSFTNGVYGVELMEYTYYDSTAGVDFKYNTLDSLAQYNYYGMLKYSSSSGSVSGVNSTINNNNFLTCLSNVEKVVLNGYNDNKLTSESLNLTSNYWGTTDSATIETLIKDYNDDINIFARANFASPLSSMNSSCSSGNKCVAEFTHEVDGKKVKLTDDSYSPNGYTVKWYYGDGNSGTSSTHTYASEGTYTVCLVITDKKGDCSDSVCHTVKISNSSSCKASFYISKVKNNPFKLYIVNTSTGTTKNTNYTWTFGDGNGSSKQRPTHKYGKFGKYYLCLTIYDSMGNCYSTYCDTIGMDSTGLILAATGFEINVVEEWQLTGVNDVEKLDVEVYPNPTQGKISLVLNENLSNEATVTVLNQMGQVLIQEVYSGKDSIDLNGMPNGLYFVRINDAKRTAVVKVMLSK